MAKTKKDIKFDVTSKLFKFKRLEFSVSSMAQRCIVGGCDSVYAKGNSGTTFHQLPFDKVKRELWVTTIQDWNGLRPLRKDSRLKKAVVCGKHFSADSFKVGLLSERKKLLPNAVPSIFFGSVQLPTEIPFPVARANNSEQPPNKKRRVSYVVTHDQGLSFKLILLYEPL
jgi:hypothetical protein